MQFLFPSFSWSEKDTNSQEFMRQYELMMIIDPSLSADEQAELIKEIETELEAVGAKIGERNHPGVRELAYKIRGSLEGNYLLYTLEKESGNFEEAISTFNIKPAIWRFMFVRIDA